MDRANHLSYFTLLLSAYCIITFLSLDMYLPALPMVANDLNITQDMTQYTITIWFLGSASLQLFLGPIADYYGRKTVFITGMLIFLIASIICAITSSYTILLLARFLQGMTVCSTMVAGLATIHDVFSGTRALQVMSTFSTITILAPALGPLAGAYVLHVSSWRLIFLVLAIITAFMIYLQIIFMPVTADKKAKLCLFAIFTDYKNILSNMLFMRYLAASSFLNAAFFMWIVESPFIIIDQLQHSALYFGYIQIPIFSAYILGGQLANYLLTKLCAHKVVIIGMTISTIMAILALICSYYNFSSNLVVTLMSGLATGAAMTFGPLNRFAIESSDAAMGSRAAITSLATSVFGVFSSILVSCFNNGTFFNLMVLITASVICAAALFVAVEKNKLN